MYPCIHHRMVATLMDVGAKEERKIWLVIKRYFRELPLCIHFGTIQNIFIEVIKSETFKFLK